MMGLTLFIRKRKVPTHPDLIVFLLYFWQKRDKKDQIVFFIGPKEGEK